MSPRRDQSSSGSATERSRLRTSLVDALRARASGRAFSAHDPLRAEELNAVLWAMQGQDTERGTRTAPSAGASRTLQLHLSVARCDGLSRGLYRYARETEALETLGTDGPSPSEVGLGCLGDTVWITAAHAIVLVSGDFSTLRHAFADQPPLGRSDRYLWIEAGCALQNAGLAAAALGISATIIGGFDDRAIAELFHIEDPLQPLAMLALGR